MQFIMEKFIYTFYEDNNLRIIVVEKFNLKYFKLETKKGDVVYGMNLGDVILNFKNATNR